MTGTDTTLTPLDRQRWILVIGTIALGMTLIVTAWAAHLGWALAACTAVVLNAIILWHIIARKDALFARLFVFGIVAGLAELPADHFSVVVKNVLTYPPAEPMLWTSPLYMPLGYSVILVQFGWVAWRVMQRHGMWASVLVTGAIGGLNVPIYEYFAKGAGYWTYHDTGMLFNTVPYYIPAGEIIFMAVLPPLVRLMERSRMRTAAALGLVEGAIMYVAWGAAFALLQ